MGAPPLPAPTETDTTTPTELTTELSKPGDEQSTYSLPDDGTPVTIKTRGHKANKSQTSLLIEYFEGSKSGGSGDGTSSRRRPSVRVRLTPSKKGKGDHIQLTETKGSRKASLTRRIPLGDAAPSRELEYLEGEDGHSMTSYASATEESNVSRDPIDIEIDRPHRRRRPASPLIPSVESYQPGNPSEISAIPTDSFLDGTGPSSDVKDPMSPTRGDGLARAAGVAGAGALAGAAINEVRNSKTRSGGKERVKVADRTKDRSDRKHRPKSRKSSVSEAPVDEIHSPRRRSSRTHNESTLSGADSSVVSSSLTPSHRSYDSHSMRSGVSKSSINNPKLLETVEDAIRRLILPELSALKREQSKREERRGSLTSTGTSASRDDVSTGRRRSSGRVDPTVHTPRRRNREARHDYGDASPMSVSRDSLNDDYVHDDAGATPSRKGDMLKGALAGAAVAKGISTLADDKSQSERRERRRRRPESARSRSLGRDRYAEEYEEEEHLAPVPLMPLMSDINPSEMTRTSILSADSDRPHSATEEMVHEVPRGMGAFPGHEGDRSVTPVNLQQTLGTNYANISTGDLNALPRGQSAELPPEYDTDEFGRKIPMRGYSGNERALSPDDEPAQSYEDQYYTTQDVPPPLKYVPYQAGARGLSPIPSVSGYTEGGSEVQQPRLSMTSDAFPSPDKAEHVRGSRSLQSLGSVPSNMRSREFDRLSAGAQSPGGSFRNAGFAEESEIDHTNSGQAVRGIAANPNIIHPVSGVESAVASLVDGDQSVLTSGSYDHGGARDSMLSYDDRSMTRSSRDVSPDKRYVDERHGTPGGRSHDQSEEFSEYEIDENGRKVPRSRYRPTASEAAITAGAVGAAAAALKRAQERKQATVQDASEEDLQPVGVARNKSFKERTMDGWEPRNTPAHSIDRFDDEEAPVMSARAMPDSTNPMPEAGYMDDDQHTNPSIVQERLDGHDLDRGQQLHDEPWSRGATPTPQNMAGVEDNVHTKEGSEGSRGLGITEAVGAAALGAAAGMAAAHSRQASHDDDWPRTSTERKRDTLLTNPYEDASPVVNPTLNENLVGGRGLDRGYNTDFAAASPGYAQKHDEGYMSNGPNQTPERDLAPKGKAVDFAAPMDVASDDPFYAPKGLNGRQLSGMSQGMASPFYDASTGGGIDRIENKDIVALMQHLMVRDAQRSARDTEIVALLMNAALDMRNSFREMKDLIQETGDDMIFANVENTEKIQKAINGPRPLHSGGPRSMQSASLHATTIDDSNAKTKNLWKRALAGLGAKGSNDLGRIEDMLMHLLGEVDVLKTQTAPAGGSNQSVRGPSGSTMQHDPDYQTDRGYEPEGVSTASHPSQSGQLSMPQANTAVPRMGADRRMSENRISTVPEGDEEYQYDHPSPSGERSNQNYLTPAQTTQRGASVPLDTPPYQPGESQAALSAENTPRTDKSKSKHKSSSSSGWIPKFSRWSETTASSVGRAFRGGKKSGKYDDYAPPSRSGSSMASYDEYKHDDDQDQLHSGFSEPNLVQHGQEPVVRSFTGPQLAPMIPEDPKYKAHRNSLNLQHPQPRPGQTERFRNALEYSAQEYDDPMTPRTADWGGSATDVHRLPPNTNRYSNASSAGVREPEYWASSPVQQDAPPRPPKEPMEDPAAQTPPRSARLENRNLNAALGVPSRKPSGPRAMTPKSPEDEAAREERRRKRDTFGTIASNETDTF